MAVLQLDLLFAIPRRREYLKMNYHSKVVFTRPKLRRVILTGTSPQNCENQDLFPVLSTTDHHSKF